MQAAPQKTPHLYCNQLDLIETLDYMDGQFRQSFHFHTSVFKSTLVRNTEPSSFHCCLHPQCGGVVVCDGSACSGTGSVMRGARYSYKTGKLLVQVTQFIAWNHHERIRKCCDAGLLKRNDNDCDISRLY